MVMRACVDGTANLRCAIREEIAYRSLRTEICRVFERTQKENWIRRVSFARLRFAELLTHHTRMAQRVSGALVYTKLYRETMDFYIRFMISQKVTRLEKIL